MITRQFAALEGTLEKIARIMTSRHGIRVSIRGQKAFINLKTLEIVLPSLSEEEAQKVAAFLDGFLDHECGHALYTDADALAALEEWPDKKEAKEVGDFSNVIEDVRTEMLQAALPGVKQNLDRLNRRLFERAEQIWQAGKLDGFPTKKLTYALERTVRGDFPHSAWKSDPDIGALITALGPEVVRARRARSTEDTIAVAKDIVAKLKALASGAPLPPPPSDEAAAGDAESGNELPKGEDAADEGDEGQEGGDRSKPNKSGIEKSQDAGGEGGADEGNDEQSDGTGDERGDGGDKTDTDQGGAPEGDGPPDDGGQPTGKDSSPKGSSHGADKPEAGDSDDADGADGEGDSDADDSGADNRATGEGEAEESADDDAEPSAEGAGDGDSPDADGDAAPGGDEGEDADGDAPGGDKPTQGAPKAAAPSRPANWGVATPEAREAAKSLKLGEAVGSIGPGLDAEGLVNDHILDVIDYATYGDPDEYVVFSQDRDTETTFTLEERAAHTELYAKLKRDARAATGAIANSLEAALFARTQARWVGGETKGKHLDGRRVQQWMFGGNDERIFRYKEEGEKLDTAITLLWDCSGSMGNSSMSGNKAALARIAAVAFHEALIRVGVPHEVLGFNTGGRDPVLSKWANDAQAAGDDMRRYCRVDELNNHFVFVPYGQTDGRAICNITGGSSNRDGEAVMWAARRLAQRQEKRKILIVGSDGQPAGARYHETEKRFLKQAVSRAIAAGLEVYGIGIMDESVKHYYPTWVIVRNASELPRVVMTRLREALTGQKGRDDHRHAGKRSA